MTMRDKMDTIKIDRPKALQNDLGILGNGLIHYVVGAIGNSVVAEGLRVACVAAVLGNPTTHYEEADNG
tara:strand:+ start:538 stop:744 length:207 start_codon:yes stop_codon:yes gene_type:complete